MHYIESFHNGGVLMWILLVCSILGLAVIIDRSWAFWRNSLDYDEFLNFLKTHLTSHKKNAVPTFRHHKSSHVATITQAYYTLLKTAPQQRDHSLARFNREIIQDLKLRMDFLKTIAQIAPLLGFLATINGLITSFYQIELLGTSAITADIAAALWENLIPSATGLMIAIPIFLAYRILTNKIDTISFQLNDTIAELNEAFTYTSEASLKNTLTSHIHHSNTHVEY
jgi:biopolymer transport protein ExbB